MAPPMVLSFVAGIRIDERLPQVELALVHLNDLRWTTRGVGCVTSHYIAKKEYRAQAITKGYKMQSQKLQIYVIPGTLYK